MKKIPNTQDEDHKGEYYVRDAQGNILAVYNTHSTYGTKLPIKEATDPIIGNPGLGLLLAEFQRAYGSFGGLFTERMAQDRPVWLEVENACIVCADNRIFMFSDKGKIMLELKVFEEVFMFRERRNSIFLFSERMCYTFSPSDYSISNIFWFNDIITEVTDHEKGFLITCFDGNQQVIF